MSDQLKKIMIGVSAGFVLIIVILFIASSCQQQIKDFNSYEKEGDTRYYSGSTVRFSN